MVKSLTESNHLYVFGYVLIRHVVLYITGLILKTYGIQVSADAAHVFASTCASVSDA